MSTAFEDTVLDFDLNFLNQTSNHAGTSSVRSNRTRSSRKKKKSISHLKQRIISTNSLIVKYYDIKDDLEDSQKNVVAVNEELKQLHIKYRNEIEKNNKLENDYQKSENERKLVDEKCFNYLNQYEAQLSHSNQLQLLLKEKDSENHKLQINNKDLIRKKLSLEEREATYLKDISLLKTLVKNILGKRTRNNKQKLKPKYKSILRKYEAFNDENISDWGDSDGDADIFEEVLSPPQRNVNIVGKKCPVAIKDVVAAEIDSEYNNEVVSIDTGRGSSLAYSDNEKCLNSPEYYINDSPVNTENMTIKTGVKVVSTATSPIPFGEMIEMATSPIQFDDMIEIATSPIPFGDKIEIATSPIPFDDITEVASCKMCLKKQNIINESAKTSSIFAIHPKSLRTVNRSVSPIKTNNSASVSTSPIKNISKCIATSPVNIFVRKTTDKQTQYAHEKECLELNNSNNIQSDSHTDYEIEMILNEMELNYKALSPIPRTPHRKSSELSNASRKSTNYVKHATNMKQIRLESELRKQTDNNNTLMSVLKFICSLVPVGNDVNNKNTDNNAAACFKNVLNTLQNSPFNNSTLNPGYNLETSHLNSVMLLDDSNLADQSSMETNADILQNEQDGCYQSPIQNVLANNLEMSRLDPEEMSLNDNIIALTPNQSPPEINTDIQNKRDEICLSTTQNVVLKKSIMNSSSNLEISQSDLTQSTDDKKLELKSYQPLSKTNTNSLQFEQYENRLPQISLPMLQNQLPIQNRHDSISTDNEKSIEIDTVILLNNSELITQPFSKDSNVKKTKGKKISKLEKLRKNLKPKYKIRTETPPLVKSRFKRKLAFSSKKGTECDTSASLNDKNVYAKAVKVMAEINSKSPNTVEIIADDQSKSPKAVKSMTDIHPKSPEDVKVVANIHSQTPKAVKVMADIHSKSPKISPKIQLAKDLLSTKDTSQLDKHLGNSINIMSSPDGTILTRNKRKYMEQFDHCSVVLTKSPTVHSASTNCNEKQGNDPSYELTSRKRSRRSSNEAEIQCKRILRSSAAHRRLSIEDNEELSKVNSNNKRKSIDSPSGHKALEKPSSGVNLSTDHKNGQKHQNLGQCESSRNSYADLDMFTEDKVEDIQRKEAPLVPVVQKNIDLSSCHPKNSILGQMLNKHCVVTVKPFVMNIPEKTIKSICQKLEHDIEKIIDVSSNEKKAAMNRLVADLQKLNSDHLVTSLVMYLTNAERKTETFGIIAYPPAPKMTKSEEVLLYVISQLQNHWPSVDIVDAVLSKIEYVLFRLNRTPEFYSIETASHFYALLCRYYRAKSRLRLFILDSMYCMQYKSVSVVKNVLEAWKEVIPLAHMPFAKCPLVTCLVYLLHFYKCNDNHNSIQDMRNILSRKYFYQITDWNQQKILEMFKNAIQELRDVPLEKKIIRLSLIILAKRQGPRWCQNNIIKKLLPSIMEANVPNYVKEFCVNMIGPLMKPYPSEMKIDCEVAISQLRNMLNNDPSQAMEEAIIKSMLCINRHDQKSVNEMLLSREMKHMSPDLQAWIRRYIKSKPLKIWSKFLWKIGEE